MQLDNDKWIGEQITDRDIVSWEEGSIITIESGTGTGKSEFIKNNYIRKLSRIKKESYYWCIG